MSLQLGELRQRDITVTVYPVLPDQVVFQVKLCPLNVSPTEHFCEDMQQKHLQRLQTLVHDCLSKHLYASAIFYADKLVSLSGAPADVFTLAQVRQA